MIRRRVTGRRRVLAIGVALLATAVATPAATAASAADPPHFSSPKPHLSADPPRPAQPPPAGFASWDEVFATQGKLNEAAMKILAAGGAGYAGVVAAPESRVLKIYWTGPVPEPVRAVAAETDVPVTFLPARFTMREMVAEAQRLSHDPRVAMIAPKVDGSGLDVTVTGPGVAGVDDVLSTARLPLTMEDGERFAPFQLPSRHLDVRPYWGGSLYETALGSCTNGFALNPLSGPFYMISAAHCANLGGLVAIGDIPVGDVILDTTARETLVIRYLDGVQGRIYTGSHLSSSSVAVGGSIPNIVGNVVCTGGAGSGEHCGLRVLTPPGVASNGRGPFIVAELPRGNCAAAPIDSGGPIYSYDRTDGRINARGIIFGGTAEFPAACPGFSPVGSSRIAFMPLRSFLGEPIGALEFYGADVLTG